MENLFSTGLETAEMAQWFATNSDLEPCFQGWAMYASGMVEHSTRPQEFNDFMVSFCMLSPAVRRLNPS